MGRRSDRQSKPLRRQRVATRSPKKTILVFCEGERTEPEYLEALKRDPEVREVAAVDLRVQRSQDGSLPLALVEKAIEARDRADDEKDEIDEFWCVFDVEWPTNHPQLDEALRLARKHQIHLAISNPCFELWLALHFAYHGAFLNNDAARRLRRSHDNQDDKGLSGARYMPLKHQARERAARLDRWHTENGTRFPNNNPSSGMHMLLTAILPIDSTSR